MTGDAWLVLATVGGVVALLATNRVTTVVGLGGGVVILLVVGAVDDEVALSGLASSATATIALLYVVAGGVAATGAVSWTIDRLLFGRGGVARLAGAMALLSAVVPNTPLVSLAAPRVIRQARHTGRSASQLLMPLSFAGILGGIVTVLGTSTNLVVSDTLVRLGDEPLGIFEITAVGLPVAFVGVLVLSLTAPVLLRRRTTAGEAMRETARTFQLQMIVVPDGPISGRTIDEAGLRALGGLFLAAVERGGRTVTTRPETRLADGDRLTFVGDISQVIDLQDVAGLVSAEQPHVLGAEAPGARLFEAVVGPQAGLVGRTLKEADFRARYDAAVLAVHRADGELRGKLGAIRLKVGDVLLVLASPGFGTRWRRHRDFSLVASVDEAPPPRRRRAGVAVASFVGMVVLAATGVTSLLVAAAIAAMVMVAGGVMNLTEARQAVDVTVVLTIAMSISLGNAAVASGLVDEFVDQLSAWTDSLGPFGVLLLLIVATQLLTEVLSNSGAAALMVPVAAASAASVGASPRDFAIGVLIAASCSFLTPIGYQTNLMVYGLGGYRFADFTRVGAPLTLVTALTASFLLTR